MRLRRALLMAAVLLALGAASTVAVAWWSSWFSSPWSSAPRAEIRELRDWEHDIDSGWTARLGGREFEVGRTRVTVLFWTDGALSPERSGVPTFSPEHVQDRARPRVSSEARWALEIWPESDFEFSALAVRRVGWPIRCLAGAWLESELYDERSYSVYAYDSSWTFPRAPRMRRSEPIPHQGGRWLPLRPLMPEFILCSTIHGVAWSSIPLAMIFVRWRVRRRFGHCPRCDQDLEHDLRSGCPRCGWRRRGRRQASATDAPARGSDRAASPELTPPADSA